MKNCYIEDLSNVTTYTKRKTQALTARDGGRTSQGPGTPQGQDSNGTVMGVTGGVSRGEDTGLRRDSCHEGNRKRTSETP